jgi:hypothetical protein
MIIGGTVSCLVITVIIIIIVATRKSKDDSGCPEFSLSACDNPMCGVFLEEPNFDLYTFGGSNKNFDEQFWKDEMFGGPITYPVNRKSADGGCPTWIENNMVQEMNEHVASKGERSGYFVLRNV